MSTWKFLFLCVISLNLGLLYNEDNSTTIFRASDIITTVPASKMKGVYILLFRITNDFSRSVGLLGRVQFEKGNYAYVGSAQSSLFPRLERHYAKKKKVYWHIDYLTASKNTNIKRAIYSPTDTKEVECRLSAMLSELSFSKPILSFGSTDCKYGCKSHLFVMNVPWKRITSSIIEIYEKLGLRPVLYKHRTRVECTARESN